MLSIMLISAALVVQYPQASTPATDTTATRRTSATSRSAQTAPVSRMAFHDRMRELWSDHTVYTRSFIVSTTGGLGDTSIVLQRLLRNQDEMADAIKPYYGEQTGGQLSSLLRNHVQLMGKTISAAKGSTGAMQGQTGMHVTRDTSAGLKQARADTMRVNSQNPTVSGRMGDTTKTQRMGDTTKTPRMGDTTRTQRMGDTTKTQRMGDTTKTQPAARGNQAKRDTAQAKQPANARVTGDTISARLPSNQYGNVRNDTVQGRVYAQNEMQVMGQTRQVDTLELNQAIAALRANGDSIAVFLGTANPRNFNRETLRGALNMHIDLLLQGATAHLKRDWQGSVAALDESFKQAMQIADMLSEGIMKQFPSRFTNTTPSVSSR